MNRIYLDHAATTPLRPEAAEAMRAGFALWANPSSPHAEGRAARRALEDARARVKTALGWQGEVIVTSGASEALAIGLGQAKAERQLVSAVEHDAVFRAAPAATVLPMGADAVVDRDALAEALTLEGRPIAAIQHVNSETGVIQPIDALTAQLRAAGGWLLADCSQSAGKYALPDADMVVISGHKLGAPIGIGALLLRDYAMLAPTGGQERGYRAGTENLPAVLALAAALEARDNLSADHGWQAAVAPAFADLAAGVLQAGGAIQAASARRDGTILSITMPGISSAAQLIQFDAAGFAVSAGSACSSGTLKPSRTLLAFGVAEETAARTIRVSAGWNSTPDHIAAFAQCWQRIAGKGRA
ncbi:aminotransferase class V-fold PLP-dependent enzyme [Altererythrobacter xixiisoli]|uniref:Cysteine desulfurase n=1 Tax=Croceibacterium xixiisoli TaxID=1476466 RepID=A0A6I4TTQ2_9SPHN|nr:aminotransferase class V-fold PLP-dependent enzyme [Croceibacterium xixiisoli]MXO99376.1 aminotransferase class V-fold PLP-dependent enzyme [Croceibacterium xixiisoli]